MKSKSQHGQVLLDSNVLIHLLRKNESVRQHILETGWRNCCVSEISIVELLFMEQNVVHIQKRTVVF